MNCTAQVSAKSLGIRSHKATHDPRCRRAAVRDGLCYQHLMVRYCAAPGCDQRAKRKEGRWWFCARHARLYADHNRIVDLIRRIPPRP